MKNLTRLFSADFHLHRFRKVQNRISYSFFGNVSRGPSVMWKRMLVSAVALASACDAFSFAPSSSFTTSAATRRASVLPQAQKAAPALGLRSLKAIATPFELPPVLGLGFKSLNKRLVVITGTTSGLGLSTLKALIRRGDSFVVCAVRDPQKMKDILQDEGIDTSALAVLKLDLGSFKSVKDFVFNLKVSRLSSFYRTHLLILAPHLSFCQAYHCQKNCVEMHGQNSSYECCAA